MNRPLNTLLFGGCLVHWPITRTGTGTRLRYDAYGPVREIHSFGEMFQIVEILRGKRTIPRELNVITRMTELGPVPGAADFRDVDVALLEPASPIELTFRGVAFNRSGIMTNFLQPLGEMGREAKKLTADWLRQGLIGRNEAIRAETAAKLVQYLGDGPEDELARDILLETRARKTDVLGGFVKMQELLNCPIGVVSYVFRYMPDGRPISWPAGFREEVLAAAKKLDLPVFDPAPMVQTFGVQAALQEDLGHYSDAFMPVAAEALVDFAEAVHRNAKFDVAATA